MGVSANTTIRLPADVARVVTSHPEFRFLMCGARMRTDWVEKTDDKTLWLEIYDPLPADAEEFMAFANRVAGHLLKEDKA